MSRRTDRLHHLDALRALAMVLILPVHAIGLIGERSGWNDVEASIFWTLHAFRMPLFFLLAGFFGGLMLERQGAVALLRNRAARIGIPLVLGTVLVVPLLTTCVNAASAPANRTGSSGPLDALLHAEPSYLWFLWYLALFYVATLAFRPAVIRADRLASRLRSAMGRLLSHPGGPLLLAIPTGCLLYRQPTWLIDSTPTASFMPVPELLAFYGVFFLSGWALFTTRGLRETIEAQPGRYILLTSLTLPPALALYLLQGHPEIGQHRVFHILALLLLSATTWSMVLGLLGLSRRYLADHSPRLRYWADASYWIYLSHFLPMAALAAVIVHIAMPWTLRLWLLSSATLAFSYFSYGAFVRYTVVGRVLHGRRRPHPVSSNRRSAAAALEA